jgi:ceramide synthetase
MLSWFATRIYAFAFHVLRSTLFESYERAAEANVDIEPHCTILNAFLLFLYCLHVYWSYLIVRIAVRQLTHGDAEDIRETEHPQRAGAGAKGGARGAVRPRALNPAGVKSVGDMPSQM